MVCCFLALRHCPWSDTLPASTPFIYCHILVDVVSLLLLLLLLANLYCCIDGDFYENILLFV